jgi:hypothetical protein
MQRMEISPNRKRTYFQKIQSRIPLLILEINNNEVWDYKIDSTTGELKAYYIGEKIWQ